MNLNPPPKVRVAIYILFGLGNLISVYLLKKNHIGTDEVALYNAIGTFVYGLASINVSTGVK